MNVTAHKLNCYIEGIRIPIQSFSVAYERNTLSTAKIMIPIGNYIDAKMWGNAFIQVTYNVLDGYGFMKEKLLYQGLCTDTIVYEEESKIEATLESLWGIFNFNSTLDYVSPKKYGIRNLDETVKIYIGNEAEIATPPLPGGDLSYKLSNRYFYIDAEKDVMNMDFNDPDVNKLMFIIQRLPFAERFAFSFFENIAYDNFVLTRAHAERFNLLNKVESPKREAKFQALTEAELSMTFGVPVELDANRVGLAYKENEFVGPISSFPKITKTVDGRPHGLEEIIAKFGKAGENIVRVQAKCGKNGALVWVEVNAGLKDIFLETFEDIERQGLSKHIKSWDAMYFYREKRPASGKKSNQLSNHSWGIAFDINVATNGLNASPSEDQKILAKVIESHGWYWGEAFNDPMHFQYCTGY